MKKIGKFLFVEQCFTDTEETKPLIQKLSVKIQIISLLNLRT